MGVARAVLAAGVALTLTATTASASDVVQGTWDDGDSFASCTAATNIRRCRYSFRSSGCTETSVVGVRLAHCEFTFTIDVTVVPIMSSAGQIVGCTSSASIPIGFAQYDSSIDAFDNPNMSDRFLFSVVDSFSDSSLATATYFIVDQDQSEGTMTWVAEGSFLTTCARDSWLWNPGGAGSVTVEV